MLEDLKYLPMYDSSEFVRMDAFHPYWCCQEKREGEMTWNGFMNYFNSMDTMLY